MPTYSWFNVGQVYPTSTPYKDGKRWLRGAIYFDARRFCRRNKITILDALLKGPDMAKMKEIDCNLNVIAINV